MENPKMAIYTHEMDISVTQFKQRCLELIRQVEESGKPVAITRRGRVVAHLEPSGPAAPRSAKPWERLRHRSQWLAEPGESFVTEEDLKGF